jgi:hypothetical protein
MAAATAFFKPQQHANAPAKVAIEPAIQPWVEK